MSLSNWTSFFDPNFCKTTCLNSRSFLMQLPRMCLYILINVTLECDLPFIHNVRIDLKSLYNVGEQFETPRTSKHHFYIGYFQAIFLTESTFEIERELLHCFLGLIYPLFGNSNTGEIWVLEKTIIGVFIFAAKKLSDALGCVVAPSLW